MLLIKTSIHLVSNKQNMKKKKTIGIVDKNGLTIEKGMSVWCPEPNSTDSYNFPFQGDVTDFRNGNLIVRDGDAEYIEIEPDTSKKDFNKMKKMPVREIALIKGWVVEESEDKFDDPNDLSDEEELYNKFHVDVPNPDIDIQEMINIDSFPTRAEAIKFAQEKFGADKNGCICLISQG